MRRGWRYAWTVLCLSAAGLCAGEAATDNSDEKAEPLRLSIAGFENRHPLMEWDWFSEAAPDLVGAFLARQPGIELLERANLQDLAHEQTATPADEPGKETSPAPRSGPKGQASNCVLGGWFEVADDVLKMEARIVRVDTGEVIWREGGESSKTDYLQLCRKLARSAVVALGRHLTGQVTEILEAPAKSPASLASHVSLYSGKRALQDGDYPRALAHFLHAVQRAPNDAQNWRQLGNVLEILGRPAAAVQAYEHALRLNPEHPDALASCWTLAHLAEGLPDPHVAADLYRQLIEEYPLRIDLQRVMKSALRHLRRNGIDDEEWFQRYCSMKGYDWSADDTAVYWYFRTFARWPAAAEGCYLLRDGVPVSVGAFSNQKLSTQANRKCASVRIAPAGKGTVLESIEVEIRDPKGSEIRTSDLLAKPLALEEGWATPLPLQDVRVEGGALKGRLSLPPGFGSGLWLELFALERQQVATTITGHSRPMQPGILKLETRPTGATIRLDGQAVGSTPCLIPDLTPGKHVLEYASKLPKGRNVSPQPEFSGRTEVEVAPTGKTRVIWRLPAQDPQVQDGLGARCPVHSAFPGDTLDAPHVAWHPELGWVLVWSENGDLQLMTSKDAVQWSEPVTLPSPVRTASIESCEELQVAPQTGRTVLLFRRGSDILSTASDDLRFWSVPRKLFSDLNEHSPSQLNSLSVGSRGRFVLFGSMSFMTPHANVQKKIFLLESFDGVTWTQVEAPRTGFPAEPQETTRLNVLPDGRLEFSTRGSTGKSLARWTSSDAQQWQAEAVTQVAEPTSGGGPQVSLVRSVYTGTGLLRMRGGWYSVSPDGQLSLRKWPVFGQSDEARVAAAPPAEPGGSERFLIVMAERNTILACMTPPPPAVANPAGDLRVEYDHPPQETVQSKPEQKKKDEPAAAPATVTTKPDTPPTTQTPDATPEVPGPVAEEPLPAKEQGGRWGVILSLLALLTIAGVAGWFIWRKRMEKQQ